MLYYEACPFKFNVKFIMSKVIFFTSRTLTQEIVIVNLYFNRECTDKGDIWWKMDVKLTRGKSCFVSYFEHRQSEIDCIQNFKKPSHSIPSSAWRVKRMTRSHMVASDIVDYIEEHIRSFHCPESYCWWSLNMHKNYLS